jgi:hypothetical protein
MGRYLMHRLHVNVYGAFLNIQEIYVLFIIAKHIT